MKFVILALCGLVFASAITATPVNNGKKLLGAKECTWGPTYWCSNLANAKNCGAVRHCIQTVWEKKNFPVDNDEICNICLDMVGQARDQLESNETQSDLKAVFEGSCNLIPIKLVRKECDKMVDDFIPELVEALSSQMNPNAVCSIAGLCNNAAIDKMLEDMPATKPDLLEIKMDEDEFTCGKCNKIASQISTKFQSSDRDDVLEQFLRACGRLSSFSDACSSIVLTYFNDIYNHMSENLNADNICHMTGVCAGKFHQHEEEIEIRPMSDVGFIPVDGGDDVPCKLCEQLVNHLRDLLVANTTELEFKQVLEGLCKQTKSFKQECLSIVDQYYEEIYNVLVNNLDSQGACFMIGVCPKGLASTISSSPIMPLIPVEISQQQQTKKLLGQNEPKLTNVEIQNAQLPIDQLMGAPLSMQLVNDGKWCTICEYFLHFVQEALSEPKNDDEIKDIVMHTCEKLPKSVINGCHTFVDLYGDAIIALLVQQIDPREICPMLKMCPTNNNDIEIFAPEQIEITIDSQAKDKPTCPLCLFAVTELQEMVKSDKTKDNIKDALSKLCSHLSAKLMMECNDFIETYSNELVEMLVSDFTPQEICVYLKLCMDNKPDLSMLNIEFGSMDDELSKSNGDIETNEIPDNTVDGKVTTLDFGSSPECLLCEEMVKEVEKRIAKKKTKESIEKALEHACDRLPKFRTKCEKYIELYGDQIIDLLMSQMAPKEVCMAVGLCILKEQEDELEVDEALMVDYVVAPAPTEFEMSAPEPPACAICEFVMVKLESELADKETEAEIENAVRKICDKMPKTITKECSNLIDQYGNLIIKLVSTLPPKEICSKLQLCTQQLDDSRLEIIECAVCQGATKTLDILLRSDKIDHDLEKIAEMSCIGCPAKYNKKCHEMVEVYGISMLKQLESKIEQPNVCVNIGMCRENQAASFNDNEEPQAEVKEVKIIPKKYPGLVGQNECTYGPTHWCSTHELATKCGAVDYCSKKKIGLFSA